MASCKWMHLVCGSGLLICFSCGVCRDIKSSGLVPVSNAMGRNPVKHCVANGGYMGGLSAGVAVRAEASVV